MDKQEMTGDSLFKIIRELDSRTELLATGQPECNLSYSTLSAAEESLTRVHIRVRRLYNAALPVMRLPPELVSGIFRIVQACQLVTRPLRTSSALNMKPPLLSCEWLYLTHICHHWREVASSCAALWTRFCVDSSEEKHIFGSGRLPLFLTNSRGAALTVQLRMSEQNIPRSLYSLATHMPRIRDLSVSGDVSGDLGWLLSTQVAPQLECLALCQTLSTSKKRTRMPFLFYGQHPRLVSLAFSGYTHYGRNTFHGLKQLQLYKQSFRTPEAFQALLDLLEGVLELEDLMFYETKWPWEGPPDLNSGFNPTHRKVHLPCLRKLALLRSENVAMFGELLDALVFAEKQGLAVTTQSYTGFGDEIEDNILDVWIGLGPKFIPEKPHALRLQQRCQLGPDLSYTVTILEDNRALHAIGYSTCENQLMMTLSYLLSIVPELWIQCSDYHFDDTMKQLLQQARAVRKLYVDLGLEDTLHVWDLLGDLARMPALSEIHFTLRPSWVGSGEIFWDALKTIIESRNAAGHTIRALHIYPTTRQYKVARPRQLQQAWLRKVSTETIEYLDKLTVHPMDSFPQMVLPSICETAPGRWKWPGWD